MFEENSQRYGFSEYVLKPVLVSFCIMEIMNERESGERDSQRIAAG